MEATIRKREIEQKSGTGESRLPLANNPPQKITLGEMRASGVRGLLIYCSDYRCSHWTAISGDRWPDAVRLSDLEPRFTCQARGTKGADVRPNFHWEVQRLCQPFRHYLRSLSYDQRSLCLHCNHGRWFGS
jgi:hypothetical protein